MVKRIRKRATNISNHLKSSKKRIKKLHRGADSKLWDKKKKAKENFKEIGIMWNINRHIDKSLMKQSKKVKTANTNEIEIEEVSLE